MTISPDALMIFRAREEEIESKHKKLPAKKGTNGLMLPNEEKEKEKALSGGKAAYGPEPVPVLLKDRVAQLEETLQMKPIPVPQAPVQSQPQSVQAAPQMQAQTQQQLQQQPQSQKQPIPAAQSKHSPKKASRTYVKAPQRDAARLSREEAKDKSCVWHSWRRAYAMCAYCHRAFCYEDTIEFNRQYYCLEDIDGVSYHYTEKTNQAGIRMGYIAGVILLLAVANFATYNFSSIISSLLYLHATGILSFIFNPNYSYAFTVLETMLMALATVAAIYLFRKSRNGFYLGVFVALANVALFIYQYTTTGVFYDLFIAGLTFAGFAVLLYSTTVHMNAEDVTNPKLEVEQEIQRWPNVGKF